MKRYLFFTMIFLFTLSIPLFSIEIITRDDKEPVFNGAVIEDDLFIGADEIEFSGEAEDVILAGTDVTFSGISSQSTHVFGMNVDIEGTIENNLIAAAETIRIKGIINDTIFAAGKTVIITDEAVINGDVLIAASDVIIQGTVNGDLYAGARLVTIETRIEGNAKIGAAKIKFNEDGYIAGNLQYWTDKELNETDKAKIGGNSVYEEDTKTFGNPNNSDINVEGEDFMRAMGVIWGIISILATLIGGLLVLTLPVFKKLEEEKSDKNVLYMFLFGLIPFFIYPAIAIVLLVFVITIPLTVLLGLAALPILFITQVIGITLFGQYLFKKFNWKKDNRFLFFLFGMIFYLVLGLIPFVSILSVIFFSSLGWGCVLEKLFQKKLA